MSKNKIIKKTISFNSANESHYLGEVRKKNFEEALEDYRANQCLTKKDAPDSEIIISLVIKALEQA